MNSRVKIEPMLAFAVDVTFFPRPLVKSLSTIKSVFDVNQSKSNIISSKQVNDDQELASMLGFQIKSLSIKYLGVSIIRKSISHCVCDFLIAVLKGIFAR